MSRILCPGLTNYTTGPADSALRIVVRSYKKFPDKCIKYVNSLNAIINILKVPVNLSFNGDWGKMTNSGWTGIVGDLEQNRADVAVAYFSMTPDRIRATKQSVPVGFSSPVSILSGRIYEKTHHNDFQVFNTFSINLWLFIILSIILFAFTHNLITCEIAQTSRALTIKRFASILFLYASALMAQSRHYFRRIPSARHGLLVGMAIMTINLLVHCFESNVLSNLMANPFYKLNSMSDLAHLLKSVNIKVYADPKISTWQFLEKSNDKYFKEVFPKIDNSKSIWNIRNDVDDLAMGKTIWIGYDSVFEYLTTAYPHMNLDISNDRYFNKPVVMLFSVNIKQDIKDKIDLVVNRLLESGLRSLWQTRLFVSRPIFLKSGMQQDEKVITLKDICGIFQLLSCLHLIAIFVIFIENNNRRRVFKNIIKGKNLCWPKN